jgi:hypothetical protein
MTETATQMKEHLHEDISKEVTAHDIFARFSHNCHFNLYTALKGWRNITEHWIV